MAMSKKKIFIGLGILVVVIVIVIISLNKNGDKGTEVQTEAAARMDIVETVTATGKIEPRTQVKISADVAGKIISLPVLEGDWVEKGDLLVRLDSERYVAALEQAEANLRSIEANSKLAKENMLKAEKDFERTKGLVEQKLESQALYDQTYSSLQVEKARYQSSLEQVDQASAAVKQARDNLSKTTIYAPMAGTISTLNKEIGEIALGSQFQEDVIMIVSKMSEMEALVNVDENDIVNVSMGDSADIEVDALPERVFNGVVREIASSASIAGLGTTEQKTEFEVKLTIIDPDEQLRPGMTASADIVIETRDSSICVPLQCVTVRTREQLKKAPPGSGNAAIPDSVLEKEYIPDKDGFVSVVFVVDGGAARAVPVKSGIQSDTHIEIIGGLAEGDEVVTGSYRAISQTLRHNSQVTVKNKEKNN